MRREHAHHLGEDGAAARREKVREGERRQARGARYINLILSPMGRIDDEVRLEVGRVVARV